MLLENHVTWIAKKKREADDIYIYIYIYISSYFAQTALSCMCISSSEIT